MKRKWNWKERLLILAPLLVFLLVAGWQKWRQISGPIQPRLIISMPQNKTLMAAAISPDAHLVALSGGNHKTLKGFVHVFNAKTGQERWTKQSNNKLDIEALSFSPDSKSVSSSFMNTFIWDSQTGQQIQKLNIKSGKFNYASTTGNSLTFSPDGSQMALGGAGFIRLWDVNTGRFVRSINSKFVGSYATESQDDIYSNQWHPHYSPEGKFLACISYKTYRNIQNLQKQISPNQIVEIWDLKRGQLVRTLTGSWIRDFEFSPDGKFITTVSMWKSAQAISRLRVLEVNTGKLIWSATEDIAVDNGSTANHEMEAVTFSPNGKIVVTMNDFAITFRDMETGKSLFTLSHPRNIKSDNGGRAFSKLEFSHDGKTLLSTHKNSVMLWDYEEIQKHFPTS